MSELERGPYLGLLTEHALVSSSRCVPRSSGSPVNAVYRGYASIVANDQHQPASSRAIAVFATVCRL